MLGYGANVQAATVLMLLFDSVAKALMARFGDPVEPGNFEMVNQVVIKVRAVIVIPIKAVVPHAATLLETQPAHLANLYRENVRVIVFAALPAFALLFAWAGGISWLLTGAYLSEFVWLLGLLALSWGCNVLASPAYFCNKRQSWVGARSLYGAQGVAFAYAIALLVGSGVLLATFQRLNGVG